MMVAQQCHAKREPKCRGYILKLPATMPYFIIGKLMAGFKKNNGKQCDSASGLNAKHEPALPPAGSKYDCQCQANFYLLKNLHYSAAINKVIKCKGN